MRLLVTRPEPDAGETAARLVAMGHEALIQPMLRVVFTDPPAALPEPAALIATSRNGIRALAAWPIAAGWRGKPLFVTGEGTARSAAEAGFTDIRSGGADAATLAGRILRDMAGQGGPLIHAAGRDRADGFGDRLAAAGCDLRVMEAYRAEPVAALDAGVAAALRAGRIDGVLVFSRRTAEAFVAAVEAAGLAGALAATPCYALAERIAGPLRALSPLVKVAERPDLDGILALIAGAGRSQLA